MVQKKSIIMAPSLLSADFTNISEAISVIEQAGGNWIHVDVMDGSFVPNITFGHKMVADIKSKTLLPLDVHLMVVQPENKVDQFIDSGSASITFHIEACIHTHRLLEKIKSSGLLAGISIVPSTPVNILTEVLNMVDIVLIMTVNPGYGGQALIQECLKKVQFLNEFRVKNNLTYKIAVDGGVNRSTIYDVRHAGTDIIVTGSAFFASKNPKEELDFLRSARINQ